MAAPTVSADLDGRVGLFYGLREDGRDGRAPGKGEKKNSGSKGDDRERSSQTDGGFEFIRSSKVPPAA